MRKKFDELPQDFILLKKNVFDKLHFDCQDLIIEKESSNYGSISLKVNRLIVKFRVSKITPNKTGQFVTCWKRNSSGKIEPFQHSDNIDFLIVSARRDTDFGQFIFPKSLLIKKGIISNINTVGKLAFRVYPPWDIAQNKQATETQKWQLNYFLNAKDIDLELAKKFIGI